MPTFPIRFALSLALALVLVSCGKDDPHPQPPPQKPDTIATPPVQPDVPHYKVEVVHAYRHDTSAFTQGLLFHEGVLYESTGLEGHSTLRRVALESGAVEKKTEMSPTVFAEGLTLVGDKLYQITWRNGQGYVYDLNTFALQKTFNYSGEGWGLATDGKLIYMSDGTNTIRVLDPNDSLKVIRKFAVYNGVRPVMRLNELEMVEGELYANIWQEDIIVRIDPATGKVIGIIDLRDLMKPEERTATMDVLNGIAYDPATKRLWLTGKNWPTLFEVQVKPVGAPVASR